MKLPSTFNANLSVAHCDHLLALEHLHSAGQASIKLEISNKCGNVQKNKHGILEIMLIWARRHVTNIMDVNGKDLGKQLVKIFQ